MFLRIFSLIVAIFSPPLSALFWQGNSGILMYLLVMLHALLLIVFCKNDCVFGSSTLNKKTPFLLLGGIVTVLILATMVFQQRIETEQHEVLDSEAVANGKRLFTSCTVCHQMTRKNKVSVGPHLVGILGRQAGSLTDYKYSKNLAQADFVWTDENIIKFLQDTNKFLPGTRMAISPLLRNDASDIVTYLKSN